MKVFWRIFRVVNIEKLRDLMFVDRGSIISWFGDEDDCGCR